MSIENFDNGSTKAAGQVTIDSFIGNCAIRGLGLAGMLLEAAGIATIFWVEPIAEAEFHAVLTKRTDQGEVSAQWLSPISARITIRDSDGSASNGTCWFIFRRIQGGQAVPIEAVPA